MDKFGNQINFIAECLDETLQLMKIDDSFFKKLCEDKNNPLKDIMGVAKVCLQNFNKLN